MTNIPDQGHPSKVEFNKVLHELFQYNASDLPEQLKKAKIKQLIPSQWEKRYQELLMIRIRNNKSKSPDRYEEK